MRSGVSTRTPALSRHGVRRPVSAYNGMGGIMFGAY